MSLDLLRIAALGVADLLDEWDRRGATRCERNAMLPDTLAIGITFGWCRFHPSGALEPAARCDVELHASDATQATMVEVTYH